MQNDMLKCKNIGILIKENLKMICSYNKLHARTFCARAHLYVHVTHTLTNAHVIFSAICCLHYWKNRRKALRALTVPSKTEFLF